MIDILNKYLIQHKSINIPGLGTIFMEHLPAQFDVANKRILPPHYEFRFNKYFDTPDKEFFTYLSYEQGIADTEAIQLYNQFADNLCTAIKQEEKAIWKDVGVFLRNNAGDIIFEQQNAPASLYAPAAATRVVRDKTAHVVLVGDQEKTNIEMSSLLNEERVEKNIIQKKPWWFFALILFVIALGFMIFHFYRNGFSMASSANQQSIEITE